MCTNELNRDFCRATIAHLWSRADSRPKCIGDRQCIDALREVGELQPLLEKLESLVSARWAASTSRRNGRFLPVEKHDQRNGAEVRIERRLVAGANSTDWANQIPLASGHLRDDTGRVARWRRMSVDLGRRVEPGSYELIELKVSSNNWLFASIEITKYGLFYSRLREDRVAYFEDQAFRQAKKVGLRVLAPPEFYSSQPELRRGFEERLSSAWRAFTRNKGVTMDFGFREWSVQPESLPEANSLRRQAESALRKCGFRKRLPVFSGNFCRWL